MQRQQQDLFIYKYFQSNSTSLTSPISLICPNSVVNQPLTSINTQMNLVNYEEKIRFIQKKFNEIKNSRQILESISEKNDTLNEPRMTIKSILTDFVVEDITLVDSSPILIYILNKLFKGFFEAFKNQTGEDYRLIYKGGNIIKLYFDDMINNFFDSSLKPEIYTKYGSNFKVSDLDFSVENFNSRTRKTKQEQSDEVIPLIWYILSIARIVILSNMDKIYDFCRFNYIEMKNEMIPILQKTESSLNNIIKELKEQLNELTQDVDQNTFSQNYRVIKLTRLIEELSNDKYIGISFNQFSYISESELQRIFQDDRFNFIDSFNEREERLIQRGGVPNFFISGRSGKSDSFTDTVYNANYKITSSHASPHLNINLYNDNLFNNGISFQSVVNQVLPDETSSLYLSTSLNIVTPRSKFSLVRLMMNFALIYTKDNKLGVINEPSELYDITYTTEKIDMIEINKKDKYNEYNYSFLNSYNQLVQDSILIWTPMELVNDLLGILFQQAEYPWEDKKYQKRLIRLIFISNYIRLLYNNDLLPDIDLTPFTMNQIQIDYIDPLQSRINRISDNKLRNDYNDEMSNLKDTIRMVQNDINKYISRTTTRSTYTSKISKFE